jgi:uncharacterized membrane protein YGL010W
MALFEEYESFHQHPKNERLHYVGIPLIVVGLFGLLSLWRTESFGDAGLWLLIFGLGWSATIAGRMLLPYSFVMGALYALGRELGWELALGAFVVGWVFQLVGHQFYEKRSPAFLQNGEHLLVGPLWIFSRFWRRLEPSSSE